MKKEIIIKLPKDAEDIQVYKKLSLDNGDSILIKVIENNRRFFTSLHGLLTFCWGSS